MRIAAAVLALATAGATLTINAAPALAETERHVLVSYEDLNLTAAAGRATLDARIRTAARRVCGLPQAVQFEEAREIRACHVTAAAQAWDQVSKAPLGSVRVSR